MKFSIFAGDKNGEGGAYGNMGICYRNLGDFEKAIEYNQKDLEIARQTGANRPQSEHSISDPLTISFLQATRAVRARHIVILETLCNPWAILRKLWSTRRKIWRSPS